MSHLAVHLLPRRRAVREGKREEIQATNRRE